MSDVARRRQRHTRGLLSRPEPLATFGKSAGLFNRDCPSLHDATPLAPPLHPAGETRERQAIAHVHRPAMIGAAGSHGETGTGQ